MADTALVMLAIGDRMSSYRQLTEPYWQRIADQLSAELLVITERLEPSRKLPAWQKLLLPSHLETRYRQIIYADVDILPHPAVPLAGLLDVPEGKVGLCAATHRLPPSVSAARRYYSRALGLPGTEVSRVQQILNTGLISWRTAGSAPICRLFESLYAGARQHCAEQTSLSWALQQQAMHHLLPGVYNTSFIKSQPFPFNTFALQKRLRQSGALAPLRDWSDRRTLRRLISNPCFIHFVGGIFEEALEEGITLLNQHLAEPGARPFTASPAGKPTPNRASLLTDRT